MGHAGNKRRQKRRPGPPRNGCPWPHRRCGQDLRREPIESRKRELGKLLRWSAQSGLQLNEHITEPGDFVFRYACKMGLEGIVSKRLGSRYRSGRSKDWLKFKNPQAPAVKREAEEDWGGRRWK
jgi:ATP-dependent DNA ligase